MIKKLKIKLIAINMILLVCVMGAIFTGIYVLMHKSMEEQAISMMRGIVQNDGRAMKLKPKIGEAPPPPLEHLRRPNSFSVKVDFQGNILELVSDFDMEDSFVEIVTTLETVFVKEKETGTIKVGDTQLRFLKQNKPYGQIVTFLDRYYEVATLNRLIFVLLTIGVISIVFLFIISLYLASWAVAPVARAWEKQKQFIADASHELKTPLTTIQTNADVVLSNTWDTVSNQIKWVGYIKSEAERMSKLVNDLLYMAKVDNNEDTNIYLPFNLSDAVINVVLPFESIIFEEGKTLDIEIAPNIDFVGDETRIKQVVVILLDNAIKNSDPNGQICISLKKNKEKIYLSVSNSGKVIPKEELDKIFERFYRPDQSRDRKTGGYGLGLSIAKSIVEQHKGKIKVTSQKEVGTTFEVIL